MVSIRCARVPGQQGVREEFKPPREESNLR
jgi:hypothetical protein